MDPIVPLPTRSISRFSPVTKQSHGRCESTFLLSRSERGLVNQRRTNHANIDMLEQLPVGNGDEHEHTLVVVAASMLSYLPMELLMPPFSQACVHYEQSAWKYIDHRISGATVSGGVKKFPRLEVAIRLVIALVKVYSKTGFDCNGDNRRGCLKCFERILRTPRVCAISAVQTSGHPTSIMPLCEARTWRLRDICAND